MQSQFSILDSWLCVFGTSGEKIDILRTKQCLHPLSIIEEGIIHGFKGTVRKASTLLLHENE